ncbi:MAG: hypothetical protein GY832_42790 [Chloroflexi bacterium]|nr:hypothetical protein [Chloroflexota bacterium]
MRKLQLLQCDQLRQHHRLIHEGGQAMLIERDPALADVARLVPVVAMNVLGIEKLQPEHPIESNHRFAALHHHHRVLACQQLSQLFGISMYGCPSIFRLA